jgi:mannose/fructose/N-acetylgalactosamine-specific phosphotransferase system component IID
MLVANGCPVQNIVQRRSILANTVPGVVFTVFVVAAAWLLGVRQELWWLSLVLIVVGVVASVVAWRKLGWDPGRVE